MNELEEFFRSSDCVCPFAASAVLHVVEPDGGSALRRRNMLYKAALDFLPTEGRKPSHALVIMAAEEPRGIDAVEEWANRTWLELHS